MSELAFKSAIELSAELRDGKIAATELLEHFIARVERFDGALNAVVVRDFERARARAKAADDARAKGENWGPLHGLPMTLKESYNIEGLPTTWGLPDMRENIAPSHSVVAQRFQDAGAVLFGKTNVPLLLGDWQSYNEVYGVTGNPWDTGRSPGGSSGGGAAALAAGLTGLESGSDIGGSIRNPAHFCGVFGHKPTWGIIPTRGHALAEVVTPSDISCVGPLARSPDDLELALDIAAGPDGPMADGWRLELAPEPRRSLAEFRVAVWADSPLAPVDAAIGDPLQALADRLGKLGARVDHNARPEIDPAASHRLYFDLLYAVLASRQPAEFIATARGELGQLDPGDRSDAAMMLRGAVTEHHQWLAWNEERNRLRWRWRDFFREHDILICPISTTAAFPHDHGEPQDARTLPVNGQSRPYRDSLFWAGLTGVSYLPSTAGPIGFTGGAPGQGLPVGVQFVGPELHDRRTIQFARLVAREIGGFTPPPGYEG